MKTFQPEAATNGKMATELEAEAEMGKGGESVHPKVYEANRETDRVRHEALEKQIASLENSRKWVIALFMGALFLAMLAQVIK